MPLFFLSTPSPSPDKFVDRDCLKLTDLITQMEDNQVAIVGPKGVGKSTLLIEAYHKARGMGKNCLYFDLSMIHTKAARQLRLHGQCPAFTQPHIHTCPGHGVIIETMLGFLQFML